MSSFLSPELPNSVYQKKENIFLPVSISSPVSEFEHVMSFLKSFLKETYVLASIIKAIVEMVEELYRIGIQIPNLKEVQQYFEKHPDLIELTKKLAILASRRLPDAIMYLEIYKDPEIDDVYPVIYARFKNYDEKVINRIRKVRKEFYSYLTDEKEWPLLTTDFRNP